MAQRFSIEQAQDAHFTVRMSGDAVSVAEFRDQTDHLFHKVNVDRCACRGAELARWVAETRKVASELSKIVCRTATRADWERRERALDASATAIIKIVLRGAA